MCIDDACSLLHRTSCKIAFEHCGSRDEDGRAIYVRRKNNNDNKQKEENEKNIHTNKSGLFVTCSLFIGHGGNNNPGV